MAGAQTWQKRRRHAGNLLLTLGALLLLVFTGFKLWSAGASDAGLEAFAAAREQQQAQPTVPTSDPAPTAAHPFMPGDRGEEPDMSLWSAPRKTAFAAASEAGEETPGAVLSIDHLGINVPVYNGASELNLNRGVARILGTARLGQGGNLGIAGHRDSFFRALKDIQLGDPLTLETLYGTQNFAVSSIEVVEPDELRVLAPSTSPTLTLVTCYPFYYVGNAPQRFIVKAKVVEDEVST